MSVRVLSDDEARAVLARHPEITASRIPSYGIVFFDEQDERDYLVGLVHATGEIRVIDATAYDEEGVRIDPDRARLFDFARRYFPVATTAFVAGQVLYELGSGAVDTGRRAAEWIASKEGSRIIIGGALLLIGLWIASSVRSAARGLGGA